MKRLTITGNIGGDPETHIDPSGNRFVTFSVAVSVGKKLTPKTDWVDIICSGRVAEIVTTYARKGTKVLVEGFPSTNAYINRDNLPIASLKLSAHSVELLSYVGEKNEAYNQLYVTSEENSIAEVN